MCGSSLASLFWIEQGNSVCKFKEKSGGEIIPTFVSQKFRHRRRCRKANLACRSALGTVDTIAQENARRFFRKFAPTCSKHALIRLGAAHDGGYLLPDDLEGIRACFSPGVSDEISFDKDLARLGMQVFLCDGSLEQPPKTLPNMDFMPCHVGAITDADQMSLHDWVDSRAPQGDLLLQMDIEGAEYEVLDALPDATLGRFRILVIEFHQMEDVFDAPWLTRADRVMDKILRQFRPVHLHENNYDVPLTVGRLKFPTVFEVTFLRRDRAFSPDCKIKIPHPLDQLNAPHLPKWRMPEFWNA